MALNELADLVDDGERVQVALALRLAPGKQAVAAQHDAVAAGILLDGALHHHGQLKAGALPGHPDQRVAELAIELVHLGFAVGRGGQRDAPVGMQMIDVRKGKKAVQRRIDRSGNGIVAEGAERIHGDHLVFGVRALVAALQRQQLLLVERGEAGALDAAQVAARAFHPEHFNRLAGQRIGLSDLGAGVAAGKVGDAQVGAEQVGAIAQQFRLVERGGDAGSQRSSRNLSAGEDSVALFIITSLRELSQA